MAQIWEYGRPFMPRRRSKRALAAITSVIAATALLMGLMPAAFAGETPTVTPAITPGGPITYGDTMTSLDATVSFSGTIDPTGVVQFGYCYDASTTPASCSIPTTIGSAVSLVDGTTGDGTATASYASWKPSAAGKYLLTMAYEGDVTYEGATSTIALTVDKKTVTATIVANDKVYDGTTSATLDSCTLATLESGDTVTCDVTSALFDSSAVGSSRTVTATMGLTGGQAGNYSLSSTSPADAAVEITQRPVDVTVQIADKPYDGTTTATVTGCTADQTDVISPEVVTCDDSGITAADFEDANVGTGKDVILTGDAALDGADVANYELGNVSVDTADITDPTSSVTYTGSTYLVTGGTSSIALSATFASDSDVCLLDDTGSIEFDVETIAGTNVPGSVFTGTMTSSTTATATTGLLATGLYTVDVLYTSSDANCADAADSAVVTIVSSGGAANGGGWYRRTDYDGEGSSRANFGFVLNKTYSGTGRNKTWTGYKGEFVWVSGQGWRVKAQLAGDTNYFGTFTCPGDVGSAPDKACGSFQATGVLEYWDETALGGAGDWAYEDDVTFTVTVYDGGSVTVCKRKACTKTEVADWFGIQIDGYAYWQVPETSPIKLLQPVGKGSIKAIGI